MNHKKLMVLDKYPILIGEDLAEMLAQFPLNNYSKVFLITDQSIDKLFNEKLKSVLPQAEKIIVSDGEEAKVIETVQNIWQELQKRGADRKSLVINFGGGVIGDMGGFAASTYMRGIDFIQIPTTLLAQVDASVGGKVGIDFGQIKNLIGSFNQPAGVIVDASLLKTLPPRIFNAGFAEIIKHGLIADKDYFDYVTIKKPEVFVTSELIEIISRSCEIKIAIVSQDVKEGGVRKLLNFGHTIGHAVESLSFKTALPLLHGEAVSIGMVVEARISQKMHLINSEELELIIKSLENTSLPTVIGDLVVDEILKLILQDKKNDNGIVNWTLLQGIGNAVFNKQVDMEIVKESLYESA